MIRNWILRVFVGDPLEPRFVRRPPKAFEWVWNGIDGKPDRMPYDSPHVHLVIETRRLTRFQKAVLWLVAR